MRSYIQMIAYYDSSQCSEAYGMQKWIDVFYPEVMYWDA